MTKTSHIEPPIDLDVLGPGELHADMAAAPCVAMIVCHGMGQQVPFETLDAVAKAITDEHEKEGTTNKSERSAEVALRFVRPTGSEKLLPRAEITLKQDGQAYKTIHLYEAYWAPLTEGVISYIQTAWALMKTGLIGLYESGKKKFSRWMFGGDKDLPIDRDTGRMLATLLVLLIPILGLPLVSAWYLKDIVENHGFISILAAFAALVWVVSYFIRQFVVQYMGDVIIYVSSNEVNSFWKVRDEIKQIGLSLAKVVYGAVGHCPSNKPAQESAEKPTPSFLYSKVVVVGHSLGSVVAYDTLNAIINQDQLDKGMRKAVERTDTLITFGSPLDKTAFLFRQKAKGAVARDMLAAAYQPMILDYGNRPKWWVNIFCRKDIISGSLEYYDDPKHANIEQRRVRNFVDLYNKINPVSAHTDYWERDPTKSFLYRAATDTMEEIEKASFSHKDNKVLINVV